jgi:hypothetical protein
VSNTITMSKTVTLVAHECCTCGVAFAMPESLMAARRRDGDWFYCPAGHPAHFTESDADKLKRALAREQEVVRQLAREKAAKDQIAATLRDASSKLAATESQLTRQKKRHAAGVCPCCKRTFQQLVRHMQSKHPDYRAEGAAP